MRQFEFLRHTLILDFPGAIIPTFPSVSFDNWKNVPGEKAATALQNSVDVEYPLQVKYEMRTISQFLDWIATGKEYHDSGALQSFCTLEGQELATWIYRCMQQQKEAEKASPFLSGGIMFTMRHALHDTKICDDTVVLNAKNAVMKIQGELVNLKNQISSFRMAFLAMHDVAVPEDFGLKKDFGKFETQSLQELDGGCCDAILKVARQTEEVAQCIHEREEIMLISVLADLGFWIEMCKAIKAATEHLSFTEDRLHHTYMPKLHQQQAAAARQTHRKEGGDVDRPSSEGLPADEVEYRQLVQEGRATFHQQLHRWEKIAKPAMTQRTGLSFLTLLTGIHSGHWTFLEKVLDAIPEPEWDDEEEWDEEYEEEAEPQEPGLSAEQETGNP
eukprot:TRINITY_DN103839_c0_g1_i1.p1 TRINITY_DN103839_c0_g1~~TRINITY_DN103839_c0_g1_i1.p1  ORF type:complete len:443 (-),score=49.63 TRINITY_DN103839_c0_g1_i1:195-1358(-)